MRVYGCTYPDVYVWMYTHTYTHTLGLFSASAWSKSAFHFQLHSESRVQPLLVTHTYSVVTLLYRIQTVLQTALQRGHFTFDFGFAIDIGFDFDFGSGFEFEFTV